jgi:ribose transport system permease protein
MDNTRRNVKLSDFASRYALLVFLLAMLGAFSIGMSSLFFTAGNFATMIQSQAILLFLALAVTVPLRTGDFDLSVGQTMVLSAVLVSILTTQYQVPVPLAVLVSILTGVAIGAINGFFVVIVRLNAFVATLGMMTLLEGIAFALTNYRVLFGLPDSLQWLSRNVIAGLPQSAYFGWILLLILWYVYEFTPLGRHLLAIGENAENARLSGIRVDSIRFGSFVAAATISAIAGVLLAGELGAMDPTIGPQYLLTPYAAAFLGSTTIQIGRFNAWGTLIGLYLLVAGITGLELMGTPTWVSSVFNGVALLAAILFARLTRGRQA